MGVRQRPGLYRFLVVVLWMLAAQAVRAEILVIANVQSGVQSLDLEQVKAIALGRNVALPNDVRLQVVDQSTTRFIFHDFHRRVTGMSRIRLNSYWARQVFTGVAQAPRRLANDAAVVAAVAADASLLGYVSALSEADRDVRVVLRIEGDIVPGDGEP